MVGRHAVTRYGDHLEISNSEVQSFMDCKRRWWLTYHRGLRPRVETPVGPLSIGARVHRALEEGYSGPGRGQAALQVLAASVAHDWPLARELGVDALKQFESEAELCLAIVEGFIEWASEEGMDAEYEVVAHERVVKAPPVIVLDEEVVLKGKLDQIVRRLMDGVLLMRDWKTTQTVDPPMIQFGPQLKMYLLLLALTEPTAQVTGGQFVFLKKVKRTARANPPFYKTEHLYVGTREMESFWTSLRGTLEHIVDTVQMLEAGGDPLYFAPPRPTRDCSWRCPFYAGCPMFDDGSRAEEWVEVNFTAGDPYAYYGVDDETKETA